MRATSEVLDDNKVRIAVEVDEHEVEEVVQHTARTLAREVRIPGFRPGRAPRQVVEARIGGAKALRTEALKETLPDYYARAVSATEVEPLGSPELNVTKGEDEGSIEFDAVVEVRPSLHVTGYGALRVTIPSPLATDDEVDSLLDRLRETDAVLVDVERPIVTGDHVTMDVRGRNAEGVELSSSTTTSTSSATARSSTPPTTSCRACGRGRPSRCPAPRRAARRCRSRPC